MYTASPVLALLALLVICAMSAPVAGQASDEEAVRATIQQYFRGHATADPNEMRKAFLPTAHIEGIRDGKFVSWTLEEYCANFRGQPAADEATRRRTIDAVDISGTAAMARATLIHGPITFTDYFVLLKVDGEWKIANKVYTSRPTGDQPPAAGGAQPGQLRLEGRVHTEMAIGGETTGWVLTISSPTDRIPWTRVELSFATEQQRRVAEQAMKADSPVAVVGNVKTVRGVEIRERVIFHVAEITLVRK
jgi:hypothetical protein